jgi:hypothetical protein
VLAAHDAAALAKWLADNQLTSTPASGRWLEHYVRMGFYYVAMRYDPPADARAPPERPDRRRDRAHLLRYADRLLPILRTGAGARPEGAARLLEVWYVGSDPVVPVAQHVEPAESPARPRWVRPLRPGKKDPRARTRLVAALLDELEALLPEGELVVQTFQDQKRRRTGFGDILFAFAEAKPLTAEQLGPLVGVLDPGLVAAAPAPEVK